MKTNFFEYLDFALQFAPAQENEKEIRAQLAKIGVGPGKTFNFKDLPIEQKLEVGLGMKEGERKVEEAVAKVGKDINGWRVGSLPGDSAHYNGDWLTRAVAAKAGIYGNDAAEAMYPLTRVDGDGKTLDGSKNNYTLTFPAGQQPPVNAFWSLTMYDGKTQLLIENPINRYLINSPMLPGMKTNADGSLTLYIQNKSPGVDKESNWLPGPERRDLPRHAPLLAEDRGALDPACRRRHLEATGNRRGEVRFALASSSWRRPGRCE